MLTFPSLGSTVSRWTGFGAGTLPSSKLNEYSGSESDEMW